MNNRIRELRKELGLSQKDFAEKIGVSQSSINYWEKGQRIPSIEAAAKIADFFNITIESLLDSEDRFINQNPLNMITGTFYDYTDNIADFHFTTDEYSIDELNQIWQFAHFIKSQRNI